MPASFWEPFDYAGTTVYYDIQNLEQSDSPAPEADLLAASWLENPARHEEQRRLLDSFRQWQAAHGKPIIFSEIGYRSEGQSGSLHMLSNLPCSAQRYSQLDYLFTTPQDFSQYRSLTISARAALPESRGELTVSLLEADGTEWQSANWLAGEQWREFKIALRAGSGQKDDTWMHPTEFVVANWFEADPHNPVNAPMELIKNPGAASFRLCSGMPAEQVKNSGNPPAG